ncbi:hypothetical protein [Paenibacillus sp. S150]|uniref:hypothetical protein n=1 Tax=Paenibacillus sp. S150 TaxID=2749826 RepID=UPI001C59DB74|nr:hypothetical protein [Paenibacillus sp. S150]MBW4080261.1 hypothetical protein [Paenibacillus sp. S150]
MYESLKRLLLNQQKFFAWIAQVLVQKLPEGRKQIEQFMLQIKEGGTAMGLEQILDAIKHEGIEQVVNHLIVEGVDQSLIARATGFSIDKIE